MTDNETLDLRVKLLKSVRLHKTFFGPEFGTQMVKDSDGLGLRHAYWMLYSIEVMIDDWPLTKCHRWLGYVQSIMIHNKLINLEQARDMSRGLDDADAV